MHITYMSYVSAHSAIIQITNFNLNRIFKINARKILHIK